MKRELAIKFEEETEEERRARLERKLTSKEKCEAILSTIEWKLREVEEDIRRRADPKKIIGYHLSPTMILLDLAKKECLTNPDRIPPRPKTYRTVVTPGFKALPLEVQKQAIYEFEEQYAEHPRRELFVLLGGKVWAKFDKYPEGLVLTFLLPSEW